MSPSRPTPAGSGTSPPRSNARVVKTVEAGQAPTLAGAAKRIKQEETQEHAIAEATNTSRGPYQLAAPIGELQAGVGSGSVDIIATMPPTARGSVDGGVYGDHRRGRLRPGLGRRQPRARGPGHDGEADRGEAGLAVKRTFDAAQASAAGAVGLNPGESLSVPVNELFDVLAPGHRGRSRATFHCRKARRRPAQGYCVMSCDVQTFPDPHRTRNSATASRDFAMNGTSTSAPGLVTSPWRHWTARFPADLKAPKRQPLVGWRPCKLDDGWGAVLDGPDVAALAEDPRGTPISITDAGAAPGRLRSPRSSPATSNASSSATPPAGRRGSRLCSTRSPSPRRRHQARWRTPRERTLRSRTATRTRSQRLRTLAALPLDVELRDPPTVPVYQTIGSQAAEMRVKGVSVTAIARHFGVDYHTAVKALRWFGRR